MRISIVGATLVALFSMTALAETKPPDTSGIEGTIVVSPTRPGPIRKDEERSVAPVRNAQFAIKAGDATVKIFTTDGEVGSSRVATWSLRHRERRRGGTNWALAFRGGCRRWPIDKGKLDC